MRSSPSATSSELCPSHHTISTDKGSRVPNGIQSVSRRRATWNSAAKIAAVARATRYHHHGARSGSR